METEFEGGSIHRNLRIIRITCEVHLIDGTV